MSKERRTGWTLLAIVGGTILLACAMLAIREARGLEYTIVFDDAKDLKRGDRVQLSGVDIGTVRSVELKTQPTEVEVKVRIGSNYADKIRSDSTAVIGGAGFPNVSGQKVVEIVNSDAEPPMSPMAKGARIKGMDGTLELGAWKLKKKLAGAKDDLVAGLDWAKSGMKDAADQIQQLRDNPEVKETVGQLRSFVEKMQTKGKAAASQLAAEWPPIKAKLQPVLQKLSDLGKTYIVDQIKKVMDRIESTFADWRGEDSPAPAATPAATPAP